MTDSFDLDDVMHRFVSPAQADRLLAGRTERVDADTGLADLDDVVWALRDSAKLEPERPDLAAAFVATLREGATRENPSGGKKPTRRRAARALAALAAASLFGGGVAAATGSLPDPVQTTVSDVFSRVGLALPDPDASEPPVETPGPDPTGAARVGLCTAAAASGSAGRSNDSVALGNLAATLEENDELCVGEVTPPEEPGAAASTRPANPNRPDSPSPGNETVSAPPVSTPPVATPPVSGPPASRPPVSTPPVSRPPVSTPPVSPPGRS